MFGNWGATLALLSQEGSTIETKSRSCEGWFQSRTLECLLGNDPPRDTSCRAALLTRGSCKTLGVLDQSRTRRDNNSGHELRNRSGLLEAVVVPPVTGRSVARASSCSNGSGVC